MSPRHVLAIAAHPDDVEFMMAGTLTRLKGLGWEVCIATIGNGDCGSAVLGRGEIARVRAGECRKSAAVLGAQFRCVGIADVRIFVNDESLMSVVETLRWARPDIVLTQPLDDYMGDHEYAGALVRHACFAAPMPNYATGAAEPLPVVDRVPHLYYADPMGLTDIFGRDVSPQFVVDITSTIAVKREMLKCHVSQRDWLLKQHGMDEYVMEMERQSRKRGALIGAEFAEGFRQHLGHGYPQDNLLYELLCK